MRSDGSSLLECLIALVVFSMVAIPALSLLMAHQTRAANALAQVQAVSWMHAQSLGVPLAPVVVAS